MNTFNSKKIIILFVLALFLMPIFISATHTGTTHTTTNTPSSFPIKIPNPLKGNATDLKTLLNSIINNVIIPIGGVVVVIMIIYAGFLYVTARGAPDKIKTAHQAILWAVVGAAILLGASVVSKAIETTINQLK